MGLEPTFTNRRAVTEWAAMAGTKRGEDAYFESDFMLRPLRRIARAIRKRYRGGVKKGDRACLFEECELEFDRDPWDVERANLRFRNDRHGDEFEVRFGLDPETFEFTIKPVPLAWFHDPRFVEFLERFVWAVPLEHGLGTTMAHGGGQFSFSAKTWLQGSLLADDVATRWNHPELATWILDYPNPDDRAFRATAPRRAAFQRVLEQYWSGAFHPRALGPLTAANALLDRGFGPACQPPPGLMDPARGPTGTARDVFQTNFAFGRAVRWQAQGVEPGYWQQAHPKSDGYRPDQVMRYGEANLNRLQIAGERHVKSGKILDPKRVPELTAPLELAMLYDEASWELRAHMSRTSAADMVEAVLLDAHHGLHLLAHPHVPLRTTLLQDQILGEAEHTLARRQPKLLAKLRRRARKQNLEASGGRIRSDWVEPETLFWAAWHALAAGDRAEIAREALTGFFARVHDAAAHDPRGGRDDPMAPHRHRLHPLLWRALRAVPAALTKHPELAREARLWAGQRRDLEARRPPWSVTSAAPPWQPAR